MCVDLDAIPQSQTDGFPLGITEVTYPTEEEVDAFLNGLTYAGDDDVEASKTFTRDGAFVVRVRVGDFYEDGDEDEYEH